MSVDYAAACVAEIQGLMREKLRIRADDLSRQIDRAGRLLPRKIARDARFVANAQALMQNPKLARMIDTRHLRDAHARVVEHLRAVDPGKQRMDRLLGTMGIVAANILLLGATLVAWLVWRGVV